VHKKATEALGELEIRKRYRTDSGALQASTLHGHPFSSPVAMVRMGIRQATVTDALNGKK
jgi:hypothetical protein